MPLAGQAQSIIATDYNSAVIAIGGQVIACLPGQQAACCPRLADDPDMDPLVYEWRVNGAVLSNNQHYTYTPGVGETGTRGVRLTVSDLNPVSLDAVETRVVLLLDEVQTPHVVGLAQQLAEDAIVGAGLRGRTKALLVNFVWLPFEGATSYRVFCKLNSELEFAEVGKLPLRSEAKRKAIGARRPSHQPSAAVFRAASRAPPR